MIAEKRSLQVCRKHGGALLALLGLLALPALSGAQPSRAQLESRARTFDRYLARASSAARLQRGDGDAARRLAGELAAFRSRSLVEGYVARLTLVGGQTRALQQTVTQEVERLGRDDFADRISDRSYVDSLRGVPEARAEMKMRAERAARDIHAAARHLARLGVETVVGDLDGASQDVEDVLAETLPVVLSFLAGLVDLPDPSQLPPPPPPPPALTALERCMARAADRQQSCLDDAATDFEAQACLATYLYETSLCLVP